uniref:Autophagy protein 5 n=1 Tax=Bursaphelenchus xylophilus TaxID=6326 RepID=A0A4D6J2Q5_BURXY|nr:autophagy protein ATG5 [Bursaphelenchus xylophilus]
MDDYEVRRNIWESTIPIEFRLGPDIVHSVKPTFLMLKRVDYFPLVMDKVLQNFTNISSTVREMEDIWLECNGKPLKWHYPVGVLYDLHSGPEQLPWTVTVRLKGFPDDLVRKEEMRNLFLQTIKEADQLKHRGNIISEMKADEHSRLFESISQGRFDDFWSINSRLMDENMFNLPIKVYLPNQTMKQLLIGIKNEENEENTLQNVISAASEGQKEDIQIISHGVPLPHHTPLLWLARNMSYPDNFIHLIFKSK